MKIDKIYTIASLIVIGAGIFAHSVTLKNKVDQLSEKSSETTISIAAIKNELINIKLQNSEIDLSTNANRKEMIRLRDEIEKTGDLLRESTAETKKLIIEYISRK